MLSSDWLLATSCNLCIVLHLLQCLLKARSSHHHCPCSATDCLCISQVFMAFNACISSFPSLPLFVWPYLIPYISVCWNMCQLCCQYAQIVQTSSALQSLLSSALGLQLSQHCICISDKSIYQHALCPSECCLFMLLKLQSTLLNCICRGKV